MPLTASPSVRTGAGTSPGRFLRRARRVVLLGVAITALVVPVTVSAAPARAGGYDLVLRDDFSGSSVDRAVWGVYDGSGGGDRVAGNTFVRDGKLVLRNQKVKGVWKGAGVSAARGNNQLYGKYEMRVRFDEGAGVRCAALLWPSNGVWPPEVDFYEIPADSPDRSLNTLTNHYGTRGARKMHHAAYRADFTAWHTVGLEWSPGRLAYTLDGVVRATMTKDVPTTKMWLGIQTRPGSDAGRKPDASTPPVVDLEVDWVKIYRYRP